MRAALGLLVLAGTATANPLDPRMFSPLSQTMYEVSEAVVQAAASYPHLQQLAPAEAGVIARGILRGAAEAAVDLPPRDDRPERGKPAGPGCIDNPLAKGCM